MVAFYLQQRVFVLGNLVLGVLAWNFFHARNGKQRKRDLLSTKY